MTVRSAAFRRNGRAWTVALDARETAIGFTLFCLGALPAILWLTSHGVFPGIPYEYLVFSLPALIASLPAFLTRPGTWMSVPVTLILLFAIMSLVWVDDSERGRGVLIFASIAATVVISAGLACSPNRLHLVHAFVFGSLLTAFVGMVAWIAGETAAFGAFKSPTGTILTNRNAIAAQLAAASVMVLALHGQSIYMSLRRIQIVPLVAYGVLSTSVVLTGSRGGFITLVIAGFVAALGFGSPKPRWLTLGVPYGAIWLLVALLAVPNPVVERFGKTNVANIGDRTPIWSAATTLLADVRTLIFGTGLGGSQKAIAAISPEIAEIKFGPDGIARVNAHSAFVDWIVNLGLPGLLLGIFFVSYTAWRALYSDFRSERTLGQGLFVFFLAASLTGVPYASAYSIAAGSIYLAYLSVGTHDPSLGKLPRSYRKRTVRRAKRA